MRYSISDWSNGFAHRRGFRTSVRKKLRSGELVVTGDQWPIFLYEGLKYDEENPWEGFLRSKIMISVSTLEKIFPIRKRPNSHCFKAYKHIFTSPSSVDGEGRATRSGNAAIHGMTNVTAASLAYVATLVCTGLFQTVD